MSLSLSCSSIVVVVVVAGAASLHFNPQTGRNSYVNLVLFFFSSSNYSFSYILLHYAARYLFISSPPPPSFHHSDAYSLIFPSASATHPLLPTPPPHCSSYLQRYLNKKYMLYLYKKLNLFTPKNKLLDHS
jgi:hypothetical protein